MGCGASSEKEKPATREVKPENKPPPQEAKKDAPPPEEEKPKEVPPPPPPPPKTEKSKKWEELKEKLPFERDASSAQRRKKLFREFDPNGNGFLSLAETDSACKNILHLDELTDDLAPILMRAFNAAKAVRKGKGKRAEQRDDYVEWCEFRMLLQYIYKYFELWFMFDEIDTSDDRRVSLEEFKQAAPKIKEWGVAISDEEASFNEIDVNGGGIVLFKEFAEWAIKKNLEVDDDSDDDFDKV